MTVRRNDTVPSAPQPRAAAASLTSEHPRVPPSVRPLALVLAFSCVLAIAIAGAPLRAQSDIAKDLVRPHEDMIARCEDALQEIERQANRRITELSQWKRFYGSVVTAAFDALVAQLKGKVEDQIEKHEKMLATARAVGRESVVLPHTRLSKSADLQKQIQSHRKQLAELGQKLARKAVALHVSFGGYIKDMPGKVLGYDEQIRDIQEKVRDGLYAIHYPGFGWTKGASLEKRIEDEQRAKQRILDKIAKGDFAMRVPGVGDRTRNQIEKEIAAVEERIAKLRATHRDGELKLHRPVFGWMSRKKLDEAVTDKAEFVQQQTKWRSDPASKLWTGTFGWVSAQSLEDAIDRIDKGISDVKQKISAGEYKIYLPYYAWIDRLGLEKAREALNKRLADPKISDKARAHATERLAVVQKGFSDMAKISALDLAIRAIDKATGSKVLAGLMTLAKPQLESRKLDLAQHQQHVDDFDRELKAALKPLEQRLAVLRRGLDYLP